MEFCRNIPYAYKISDRTRLPDLAPEPLALPPIGPTAAKFGKYLWYVVEAGVSIGIQHLNFDGGEEITAASTSGGAQPDEWRRFRVVWEDLVSGDTADTQVFKLDIVNYTGGTIDSSWTTADHQACGTAIANFVTSIAPYVASQLHNTSIKAYRMAYNTYSYTVTDENGRVTHPPFVDSGGPAWTAVQATQGTSGGQTGPQTSSTVTLCTAVRRNWGRLYLPTIGYTALTPGGRLTNAAVDAIAAAASTLVSALYASDMFIVVPATTVDGKPARALQNVNQIRVDDVVDVQRRRRSATTLYRKKYDESGPSAEQHTPADELNAIAA